ncbi:hypothetical protein LRP88_12598 [Fusarium phalaenopsidis]
MNKEQPDVVQEEHGEKGAHEATAVTSAFAGLTRAQCVKKFWRLYITGLGVSLAGIIIANEGFIQYFATVEDPDTGKPALNAQHISLWSACYFITSILIQTIAPVTADKFGRKFNMWGVTFFLTTFRGALLGSFSLSFALGQVFLAVALKVLEETDHMAFRHIFYSEFVFTGLWLFPMLYLPESPGNVEGYDFDHEYSVFRYEFVESLSMAKYGDENSDWKALFTSKTNLKRAIISTLPFTFQNIVGVPLMFGYTTYFFQLAGADDPFLGNIVKQMVLVVGILISFYTVDKVGRRTLVIAGGAAMATICFIVGGLGFMKQTSASGMALNYTVPLMLSNQGAGWGQKIGLFFGGITLVYLIPCVLMFPETKGRTYHELDELFEQHIPAWRFASTKTSHQLELESKAAETEKS